MARLLPALAERRLDGLRCVATSPETEVVATGLGLTVERFDALDRLDVAIDGADQVAADWWTVKGGHGAHLREKIVAAAAERFVVIVSEDKLVDAVHAPVPLELYVFGRPATLRAVGAVTQRAGAGVTPEGGVIADYTGGIADPAEATECSLRHTAAGIAGPAFRKQHGRRLLPHKVNPAANAACSWAAWACSSRRTSADSWL